MTHKELSLFALLVRSLIPGGCKEIMEFLESDDTLSVEDKLSSFSADLVSGEDIFISRLFAYPPGIAIDLDELCRSL